MGQAEQDIKLLTEDNTLRSMCPEVENKVSDKWSKYVHIFFLIVDYAIVYNSLILEFTLERIEVEI